MNGRRKIWSLTREIAISYKDKNKGKGTEGQSTEPEDRPVETI